MPKIADFRIIDGATWVRVEITEDQGRLQILSDAEIAERDKQMQHLLRDHDRYHDALLAIDRAATARRRGAIAEAQHIARKALGLKA